MAADIGTGTTITFATSGFTLGVTGIKVGGVSVPSVDTTLLNPTLAGAGQDGGATSIPGRIQTLEDVEVEVQFEAGTAKHMRVGQTPETITITFYSGKTHSGLGYIKSKSGVDVTKDGLMMMTLVLARSGVWAWSA